MDRGLLESLANIWDKMTHFTTVKFLGASLYVVLSFLYDPFQTMGLIALFILIIADFMTALLNAYTHKIEIKSRKIFTTAIKVTIYFGLIAMGHITEHAVPILEGFLDETLLAFLALTELISILENCGKLGFAVPKKLLNKLEELRDEK
jgi:toxin secretion/phage lysis holin